MQLDADHAYAAMDFLQKADQLQLHIPCVHMQCNVQLLMNVRGLVSGSCFWQEICRHIDLLMAPNPCTRNPFCVYNVKLPWNSKCTEPSCLFYAPTVQKMQRTVASMLATQ